MKGLAQTFSFIVFIINRLHPGNYFNRTVPIFVINRLHQKGLDLYSFRSVSIIHIYIAPSISHTKKFESIFISIYLPHPYIHTTIYIAYKQALIYIHFIQSISIAIYATYKHVCFYTVCKICISFLFYK